MLGGNLPRYFSTVAAPHTSLDVVCESACFRPTQAALTQLKRARRVQIKPNPSRTDCL